MLIGVSAFSFATGSLSSLMNSLDTVSAKMKKKVQILDNIKKQYQINPLLYEKIQQAIKFEAENDKSDIIKFIKELPN